MRASIVLSVFVLLLAYATSASAHRLNVFAFVDGSTITGSAYFSGGGAPSGATVTVFGPDGAVLAETVTDEAGGFSVDATQRVDHRITVETADGHAADFLITAAELPPDLPGPDPVETAASALAVGASPVEPAARADGPAATVDEAALEALVARAVQRQIAPLREQILAYGDAVRLSDILGGIGYIVGIFGIAAYAMSLRRRSRDSGHSNRGAAD